MKIAFVNIYQGQVNRGAETYVIELAKRLGQNHTIYSIGYDGRKIPSRWPLLWRFFLDPQGIKIFFFTLKAIPRVWREKYDVVVALNGGWQVAVLRIVTWLYGGKLLVSGQSGIGWDDRVNLWAFPNVFVALSQKACHWAKRVNPLVKSVYIPNGVDLDVFKPEGEKSKTNLKQPIVLCVGALEKDKRIDLTIKAVAKVLGADLLICGYGSLEKDLKELAYRLLPGRVEFVQVSYKDINKIYRVADMFTLASTPSHSFEIVLAEAMATNLPVVANCDEIRAEIVGKAGILTNPNDSQQYANDIKSVLAKKWGNIPREQAMKFSWDNIAKEYEKLIKGLEK
jgi:glycosyltransferase involved in cell wall biosynthesis